MLFEQHEFLSSDDLISTSAMNYCLDKAIIDRIEIYTTTFNGDNGNTKFIKIDNMSNMLL